MLSDQELIELFNDPASSEQAFRLIIRQYQKQVYYYIRRMVLDHDDADDVTQNTFIKAWKGLPGFRAEAKLSTWLHSIAYHESLSFLEKKKRVGRIPLEDIAHHLADALDEDPLYTGDEIQRLLQVAVATLPDKQKAVFVMKYYDEMKYEDMSEVTGTSVGALKASYHHAVRKIEDHLRGAGDMSLTTKDNE